jgi:hypothetical protein
LCRAHANLTGSISMAITNLPNGNNDQCYGERVCREENWSHLACKLVQTE